MNPSYGIMLWMLIGALEGWLASRLRDGRGVDAGSVVAGIIGAVTGGAIVELALRDSPSVGGFIVSLLVALLGAAVGQAVCPHPRRHAT
jgi:uncharacterized membrane protein YeaQ/YmgE (transglycosylase-associated protein family)